MKKYVFRLEIFEGNDEFWKDINHNKKSGVDEVTLLIYEMLAHCLKEGI